MKNEFIDLVSKQYTQDDYGVQRHVEVKHTNIACHVKSAGAKEWFEGGRQGLNPQYTFIIRRIEYNDESVVIYDGKRYQVYRTYISVDDIELHCQLEKGA